MLNCQSSVCPQVLHLKSLPLQVDVLAFDFLDRPSVSWPPVRCRDRHAAIMPYLSQPKRAPGTTEATSSL